MEQIIILSENDIAQIIANSYDCDFNNVKLEAQVTYEGWGPTEHPVARCKAIVKINQGGKHNHA